MISECLVNVGVVNDAHTARSVGYRHRHFCSPAGVHAETRAFQNTQAETARLFVHTAAGAGPTGTATIPYALHVGGFATRSMCGCVEKTNTLAGASQNQTDPTLGFTQIPRGSQQIEWHFGLYTSFSG